MEHVARVHQGCLVAHVARDVPELAGGWVLRWYLNMIRTNVL